MDMERKREQERQWWVPAFHAVGLANHVPRARNPLHPDIISHLHASWLSHAAPHLPLSQSTMSGNA